MRENLTIRTTLTLASVFAFALSACADDSDDTANSNPDDAGADIASGVDVSESGDAGADAGAEEVADAGSAETDAAGATPLELSPELCDDPANLQAVIESLGAGADADSGGGLSMNQDQLQRLLSNPTETFYMVNLIRYREVAEYPDGRQTDLSGREANAIYDPLPFIQAIGGRVVYNATVDEQIAGAEDVAWDDVAIVEYSCPIAFLAMTTHPEFQATAVHKDAGVETTRVMFAELQPLPPPTDPDQSEAAYPPTAEDPALDLMHVMDFHDIAQYEPDVDEPERTGEEAWNMYQSNATGVSSELGHYSTAFFKVRGTLIGENTGWDEIQIVHMSSRAGFEALLDDETRQAGRYHRYAALADNDSVIMYPALSSIPYADIDGSTAPPEVTPNGTGTLCQEDADCPDERFLCLSDGGAGGFCTLEGCAPGACEGSYVCCHDCNPAMSSQLPFEGSACFPSEFSAALTNAPVSCTCD